MYEIAMRNLAEQPIDDQEALLRAIYPFEKRKDIRAQKLNPAEYQNGANYFINGLRMFAG